MPGRRPVPGAVRKSHDGVYDNTADPAAYPDEVAFLQTVLGNFTAAVMAYVRGTYANARFEVLYPVDVNQTNFNRAINYPPSQWTAATLDLS